MGGYLGAIGTAAGAAIGFSMGGPLGARSGAQIGATLGSIADAFTGRSVRNDPRWIGVSLGTSIPRAWGQNRTPGQIFWGLRNPVDGSYLFAHNSFKAKLKGTTEHYHASFAFLGPITSATYADGTQVERKIVWDRIWMQDQIVWQSSSAVPIAAWSSSEVYGFGDPVTRFGVTYVSNVDDNLNEDPSVTGTLFWKVAQDLSATAIDITFHPGPSESVFTQAVDSLIATNEGAANTPAFRGKNYAVVNDMDLYFIGNNVPQNISIEWHYSVAPNDEVVFADIAGLCGLRSTEYNFSGASNSLTGYVQRTQTSGQDLLNPMLGAKAYDMAVIDGVLQVVQRGGASVVTIPDSDLGACFAGDKPPERVEVNILCDRRTLYTQAQVMFSDQNCNFRDASQTAVRNSFSAPKPTQIETGLTMTPTEGAQMAGRILDTQWLEEGREYKISLPGSYAYLVPTDVITFNFPVGVPTRFRIVHYEENHGLVKLTCVRDETQVLVRYEVGDDGTAAYPATTLVIPTKAVIASPQEDFSDQFASYPGFYIWANGAQGWMGCQVWYTFDSPGAGTRNWISGPYIGTASAFGTASAALGNATASGYESTNSVSVVLTIAATMGLASNSQAAVNNGTAWAILGNEILGLVTVVQTSGNTWTLGPGLVRGLRSSPFTGHATNELFAIAPSVSQTTKQQVDAQYIGSTVYVQCLSPGQSIGDVDELSCVIQSPTPAWVAAMPTPFQETPAGAVNGANTTFTLSHAPRSHTLQLYVNGSPLIPGTGYTIAGTTITTAAAPATGQSIYAFYSY